MLDKDFLRKFDPKLLEQLADCYRNKKPFSSGKGIELYHEPFTHCVISDLLVKEEFINDLKKEMVSKLKYAQKNNDLYKFHQTSDLSKCKSANISKFRDEILYGSLLGVLKQITGIELSSTKIDVTSSKYEQTDYLLCHDDDIHDDANNHGRRIAFIYYLVPPEWDSSNSGGNLDLFRVNDNLQPVEIVKSLTPKLNRLLFFEVSDRSFHQVSEVFNESKARLSINGWFHGPINFRPAPYIDFPAEPSPYVHIEPNLFFDWVAEKYIKPINQTQIQMKFKNSSEIKLDRIFNAQKYEQISEALGSKSIVWTKKGPYNRRNYEVAEIDSVPAIVRDLIQVLTSDFMGLTLTNMTGLALHSSVPKHSNDEDEDEDEDDEDEEDEFDEEDFDDDNDDDDDDDDDEEDEEDEDDEDEDEEEDENVPRSSGSSSKRKRPAADDDDESSDDDSEPADENKPCTSSSLARSENLYKKFKTNQQASSSSSSAGATTSTADDKPTTSAAAAARSDSSDSSEPTATVASTSAAAAVEMADPKCSFEIRRWKQGHYTLITDDDAELKTKALDLMVFFKCKSWSLDCGGNVSYIARFEDNELLTVNPEENCISLVYRDEETLKFTKYVNSKIGKLNSDACFYEISVIYYE